MNDFDINNIIRDLNDQQKILFAIEYQFSSVNQRSATIWAFFNLDRIYLGQIFIGLLKFITGGGLGIWWLIDVFSIQTRVDQINHMVANQISRSINSNRNP